MDSFTVGNKYLEHAYLINKLQDSVYVIQLEITDSDPFNLPPFKKFNPGLVSPNI